MARAGLFRGHEVGDLIAVAAPLYAKLGLRNSRGLYPSGLHFRNDVSPSPVRRCDEPPSPSNGSSA